MYEQEKSEIQILKSYLQTQIPSTPLPPNDDRAKLSCCKLCKVQPEKMEPLRCRFTRWTSERKDESPTNVLN